MTPDIEAGFDGSQQVFVPLDLEIRMEPALHENTGPAQIHGFLNLVQNDFFG